MIIVTKEQFFNFIKFQPDDRKLNFKEFTQGASCGCPMIHYSREILNKNDLNASSSDWYEKYSFIDNNTPNYKSHAEFEKNFNLSSFMPDNYQFITTYGELKKSLIKRYPEFNWSE